MNNKGTTFGEAIVIILIIALIIFVLYLIYWGITMYMKVFELLFGNGWFYIGFFILGGILSIINIPLYKIRLGARVYVNLGGCILPVVLTSYLLYLIWPVTSLLILIVALFITITISRAVSWYVKGKGVLIVGIVVILASTLIAHFLPFSTNNLNSDLLPLKLAFGYIIATVGVLVGGDLLHLGMIERDASWGDKLSIGGAGTKDGVWLIGLNTMFLILLLHNIFGW